MFEKMKTNLAVLAVIIAIILVLSCNQNVVENDSNSTNIENDYNSADEDEKMDILKLLDEICSEKYSPDDVEFLHFNPSTDSVPVRREISNKKPLFVFYQYSSASLENTKKIYEAIPVDLRPYSAILFPGAEEQYLRYNKPMDEYIERITPSLEYCETKGVDFIVRTGIWDTDINQKLDRDVYDEMFKKYTKMIGLTVIEQSCKDLNEEQYARLKKDVKVCIDNGGVFFWKDMGYPGRANVFLKATEDKEFYELLMKNPDNMVFERKHNGWGNAQSMQQTAIGMWMAGLSSNWGTHIENFMWYESGFFELFEPSKGARSGAYGYPSADQYALSALRYYPISLFGIEIIEAMLAGSTVYTLETPEIAFMNIASGRRTPAFDKIIYPLFKMMIEEDTIPSREEVLSRIKVAFHATDYLSREVTLSDITINKGIYTPERYSSDDLSRLRCFPSWIKQSGRYEIMPVLPKYFDGTDMFDYIISNSSYREWLSDVETRKKVFDEIYPEFVSGNSFGYESKDKWYLFNPIENMNIDTEFSFSINSNRITQLSGNLPPHTYSIVNENNDTLFIYLNNLRANPKRIHMPFYLDGLVFSEEFDFRNTVIRVCLQDGKNPEIKVAGDNDYSYTSSFDKQNEKLILDIRHNGPIEIEILFPDSDRE